MLPFTKLWSNKRFPLQKLASARFSNLERPFWQLPILSKDDTTISKRLKKISTFKQPSYRDSTWSLSSKTFETKNKTKKSHGTAFTASRFHSFADMCIGRAKWALLQKRHLLRLLHWIAWVSIRSISRRAFKDVDFLRQYTHFCRTEGTPHLTDEALEILENEYVNMREEVTWIWLFINVNWL